MYNILSIGRASVFVMPCFSKQHRTNRRGKFVLGKVPSNYTAKNQCKSLGEWLMDPHAYECGDLGVSGPEWTRASEWVQEKRNEQRIPRATNVENWECGARVNQHPPLHQLAILSIGWVTFFHPTPDLALTKIAPHSTILACRPFDVFSWMGFFGNSDLHTTVAVIYHPTPPSYPIDLITLLTYIFN
jgi:hypothetical protein